jgi:hypothetical protein
MMVMPPAGKAGVGELRAYLLGLRLGLWIAGARRVGACHSGSGRLLI